MFTWDAWFQSHQWYVIEGLPAYVLGFIAYLTITFVFYWWHRVRHDSFFLWKTLHQLHHSASRLETITSFYKHPLEIFINSLLMGVISYLVLGLNALYSYQKAKVLDCTKKMLNGTCPPYSLLGCMAHK